MQLTQENLRKIQKDKAADPSEFEETVAQAFFDLENTNTDLKSDLKDLYINSAVLIVVSNNRKATVKNVVEKPQHDHLPLIEASRLRKAYRKINVRLVNELEKKFTDEIFGRETGAGNLLRLKEPAVLLRCRKSDAHMVQSVVHSAEKEYAHIADVHPPEFIVDTIYLPPAPTHHNTHDLTCAGGVVLASRDGKIVFENTLDARLDVAFCKKLPQIDEVQPCATLGGIGEKKKKKKGKKEFKRQENNSLNLLT